MLKNKLGFGVFTFVLGFVLSVAFYTEASAYSASIDETELIQGECLTFTWSGFGDTCNIIVYKGNNFWTYANTNASYQGTQEICTSGWEIRDDYKIRVELKTNTTIYLYSQTFEVMGPKPYLMDFLIDGGASSTDSQNVFLQFNYVTADPTHYMASEYSNFSGATWLTYTGSNVVNFTLSDGSTGTRFVFFKLKNASGESNVRMGNISYQPLLYYKVSGYIRDSSNQSVGVVTISGFPNGDVNTDVNGYYYVDQIISTWTGTITPSKAGYTFSPSQRTFSGLSSDVTQNFTAIPNVSYSWQTGDWGACNDTCSGGIKRRTVQCVDSNGQVVSDSYCTETKPDTESDDCPELGPSRLNNDMGTETYVAP